MRLTVGLAGGRRRAAHLLVLLVSVFLFRVSASKGRCVRRIKADGCIDEGQLWVSKVIAYGVALAQLYRGGIGSPRALPFVILFYWCRGSLWAWVTSFGFCRKSQSLRCALSFSGFLLLSALLCLRKRCPPRSAFRSLRASSVCWTLCCPG